MKKKFNKSIIIVTIVCVLPLWLSDCASYENYLHRMYHYGNITDLKDKEIIFEIGYRERVQIGENAYKIIKASPGFTRRHKKIIMAILEITGFEGDQLAKARIIAGHIDKDCMIDL